MAQIHFLGQRPPVEYVVRVSHHYNGTVVVRAAVLQRNQVLHDPEFSRPYLACAAMTAAIARGEDSRTLLGRELLARLVNKSVHVLLLPILRSVIAVHSRLSCRRSRIRRKSMRALRMFALRFASAAL